MRFWKFVKKSLATFGYSFAGYAILLLGLYALAAVFALVAKLSGFDN